MPVVHPKRPRSFLARTPVASAVLLALASSAVLGQETSTLGEVIVTAQKREQSLQDVPISIKALDEETLDELNIQNFKDYVQFLPTVTMSATDGAGSGYNAVYMRGVATGGDGQATTSQPSVGMYLDEQPITTIQGNLDVHLYDSTGVDLTPCSPASPGTCNLNNGQSADSNEHYVFTAPAACSSLCTYYVVVRGWDDSENQYDIRIEVP